MAKENGDDVQVESESLVQPVSGPPMSALPFEIRAKMFAEEYNALCKKYKVGLRLVTRNVSEQYVVTEMQPVPLFENQ